MVTFACVSITEGSITLQLKIGICYHWLASPQIDYAKQNNSPSLPS